MLLIVLGHNAALVALWPKGQIWLYGFHVQAFLLLPFRGPESPASRARILDLTVRYLVPFAAFYLATAALFQLVLGEGGPWHVVARDVFVGLVTGSAVTLDRACGFALFWFLPTLWSLTLLRMGVRELWSRSGPAARAFAALLVVAPLGLMGLIAEPAAYLPMGLGPALYALPLGFAVALLAPAARRAPALTVVLAVVLAIASRALNHRTNVATLVVATWPEPLAMAAEAAHAVSALLALLVVAPGLVRVPGLVAFGQRSLPVFLTHSLFLQALLLGGRALGFAPLGDDAVAFAVLGTIVAVAGGLVSAWVIERPWLRPWLLPRGVRDWPPTASRLREGNEQPGRA
jgi:fucose 4-O-acetylase-like acetyltransferase